MSDFGELESGRRPQDSSIAGLIRPIEEAMQRRSEELGEVHGGKSTVA